MKTCAQCQIKYPDALEFCPQDGTPLPPAPGQRTPTQALYDALIGSTIDGRYLVEAKLGEGGMGVVYAARHVIIDKRVAIKVLKASAQEEPTAGQRFIQEAKSASKIGHANIVDITDFGILSDGSAYFVMEFLEGLTLAEAIKQGPLGSMRVIGIAAQIARGLNAAHGKGIIHRDLKPENIFLLEKDGQSDVVKIVDFGIAKIQEGANLGMAAGQRLTQAGMVLGTPEYMSPEQATGKETDHRVDEYALGCIMYEMLTGDVPYRGETSAGTLTKHVFDPIVSTRKKRPDLDISPALDAIVCRAMGKKADDRYPSMKELLGALDEAAQEIESGRESERIQQAKAEAARPTMMGELSDDDLAEVQAAIGRTPRKSRNVLVGVGVFAVVACGLAVFAVLHSSSASQAKPAIAAAVATPPPVTPPPAPTPPKPALPADVEITLRSTPSGARILRDGSEVGMTPAKLALAQGGDAVTFTFQLEGYKETSETVVPDGTKAVNVTLSAIPRKSSPPRVASKSSSHAPPPPKSDKPKVENNSDLRNPFE